MPAARFFPRFLSATGILLVLGPALTACFWLTGVCADLLGVGRFGSGLTESWIFFALRVSLGVLLPPFLVAAADRRRTFTPRLVAALRASLICFALFAVLLLLCGLALRLISPGLPLFLAPMLLARVASPGMCLLSGLSYLLISLLLPLPAPGAEPPASIRLFCLLGLALLLTAPLHLLVSTTGTAPIFADIFRHEPDAPLRDLFLPAALILFIRCTGRRLLGPAFTALCLAGPILALAALPGYSHPGQILLLGRAVLALAACLCLQMRSARRWLVE